MIRTSEAIFSKTISGKFSNKLQALENPSKFPHINIYFRPLPWDLFNSQSFYTEQSYNYLPWKPYRQSVNRLTSDNKKFIIENYEIINNVRVAGGGFTPELLQKLTRQNLRKREGCSMHFTEIKAGKYYGFLSPAKQCCISQNNSKVYVVSKVIFDHKKWISEDSGYNLSTNKKVWGSSYGPLIFKKILAYS